MIQQETPSSFQSSVEFRFASGTTDAPKLKPGEDIALVVRFRDFLGEPTSDVGTVTLSTSQGTLHLPNGGRGGEAVQLDASAAPIGETGELPVVLRPGQSRGRAEVTVSCKLGEARLTVDIPRGAGFAVSEMMESVIYAFLVAIIIRIFFFQTFWIPSGSMEPTLYQGDRIIANKLIYRLREPHRGEVVIFRVFQPPRRGVPGRLTLEEAYAAAGETGPLRSGGVEVELPRIEVQDYIKRVVGLPGDVVQVDGGVIYVNGAPVEESFDTTPPDYDRYGPITVPPGEVFVMGDNRSNSQDSHVIGTVPIRNIEGRAEAVFWPPSRIRLIPQGR